MHQTNPALGLEWKRPSRTLLCIAALAVVIAVLLHESLFLGKGLSAADGILRFPPWNTVEDRYPSNYMLIDQFSTFLPQREFFHQRIVQGDFPMWNPQLDCGIPNLASIQ